MRRYGNTIHERTLWLLRAAKYERTHCSFDIQFASMILTEDAGHRQSNGSRSPFAAVRIVMFMIVPSCRSAQNSMSKLDWNSSKPAGSGPIRIRIAAFRATACAPIDMPLEKPHVNVGTQRKCRREVFKYSRRCLMLEPSNIRIEAAISQECNRVS